MAPIDVHEAVQKHFGGVCDLDEKGNLVCLAIGHMVHVKSCLGENYIGMKDMPFIFTKGTCLSL